MGKRMLKCKKKIESTSDMASESTRESVRTLQGKDRSKLVT